MLLSAYFYSNQREQHADHMYTNRRKANRAVALPHLGFSDRISILLVPKHYRVLKQKNTTEDNVELVEWWSCFHAPGLF